MAHSCVSSFLKFNSSSLSLSYTNPSSSPPSTSSKPVSFLFQTLRSRYEFCRNSKKKSNLNPSFVKAVHAPQFYPPEMSSRNGISSIRDKICKSHPRRTFQHMRKGHRAPPPMVQERFMSVISLFFQYRIIRCGGAVDDDMANIIVSQLLYLDAVDLTKDIVMYVNSPGGSVTAGMAIFDTMRHIRPDVSTVRVGLAAREAKEYGLIDGVILNPLKALQPVATAEQQQCVNLHLFT